MPSPPNKDRLPKQFRLLFYPEDIDFNLLLDYCDRRSFYYAGILHDNPDDLRKENGEEKKPHWHFVIWTDSRTQCLLETFFAQTGLSSRFMRPCRDLDNAILYLTHESPSAIEEKKILYPVQNIVTNADTDFLKAVRSHEHSIDETSAIIDDCILYALGHINFNDLIKKHPQLFFQMNNVKTFVDMYYNYYQRSVDDLYKKHEANIEFLERCYARKQTNNETVVQEVFENLPFPWERS